MEGVDVSHCRIRRVRNIRTDGMRLLWIHFSPPLSEIIKPVLKLSQNLYAETLTRTLGLVLGRSGSFADGKEIVEEALSTMKIERGTYVYADASGMSRYNLLSADLLAQVLRFMHGHNYFPVFFDALSIAGVDGTTENRMKGTKAVNNVRAKTGSLLNVKTISGYVRTADGEMLAFSMLANNFLGSGRAAEAVQDAALEALAAFRRTARGLRKTPPPTVGQ